MKLYAITDRSLLRKASSAPDHQECAHGSITAEVQASLVSLARSWAQGGVHYIQVREKDVSADALEALSRAVVQATRPFQARVLVNGSPRLAVASGADGIHLPGGWTAEAIAAVRSVFRQNGRDAVVSVACHSAAEVMLARDLGIDLALLSPVFEKRLRQPGAEPSEENQQTADELRGQPATPMGLAAFRQACTLAAPLPVFALGGVTMANARHCVEAGAAGIAAIRFFMDGSWRSLASEGGSAESEKP